MALADVYLLEPSAMHDKHILKNSRVCRVSRAAPHRHIVDPPVIHLVLISYSLNNHVHLVLIYHIRYSWIYLTGNTNLHHSIISAVPRSFTPSLALSFHLSPPFFSCSLFLYFSHLSVTFLSLLHVPISSSSLSLSASRCLSSCSTELYVSLSSLFFLYVRHLSLSPLRVTVVHSPLLCPYISLSNSPLYPIISLSLSLSLFP